MTSTEAAPGQAGSHGCTDDLHVAVLGGGVGTSRLAVGLERMLTAGALSCVVNTGDDLWLHGLRVCPDLDTNLYALSGLRDVARGWGISGDTFRTMDRVRGLGGTAWFALGDLDLATHMVRTELLADGHDLTSVTALLTDRCAVPSQLLPMTDTEVSTRICTPSGELSFQEYFVQRAAQDVVEGVVYDGIGSAVPTEDVLEALRSADVVVIGPSNPVASIGPILALPGIEETLRERAKPVVAVSPMVRAVPPSSEGDKRRAHCREALMAVRDLPHRPSAVAWMLHDLIDVFVLDTVDSRERDAIRAQGIDVVLANTLADEAGVAGDLATAVLHAAAVVAARPARQRG